MLIPRALRLVPCLFPLALLIAAAPPSRDEGESNLLVQAAMQQGKESLSRGEYGNAVRALEAQLPKINGNAAYLRLLEDAYRGYVKELAAKGETELANKYHQKLSILDGGAKLETAVRPATLNDPPKEVIRAKREEDPAGGKSLADALANAEKEFRAKQYRIAERFYSQAYQLDKQLAVSHRERWAYAKLWCVAETLNKEETADRKALENETRLAIELAPRLEFGQTILKSLADPAKRIEPKAPAKTAIKHLSDRQGGWQVCESTNFRVFHQDAKLGEQVAIGAEEARAAVLAKWVGDRSPAAWRSPCDVYLHSDAQAYAKATQAPAESPGHSTMDIGPNGVETRRIDLHVDDPRMLAAIVPHETTHVTLADQFGPKPIPRWADEGLALLSEPPDHMKRLLKPLADAMREGRVFTAKQLMAQEQYPDRRMLEPFYAQSALLVLHISERKGPQVFGHFLTDAQKQGFEKSLELHYGIKSFDELEKDWKKQVAGIMDGSIKVAAR